MLTVRSEAIYYGRDYCSQSMQKIVLNLSLFHHLHRNDESCWLSLIVPRSYFVVWIYRTLFCWGWILCPHWHGALRWTGLDASLNLKNDVSMKFYSFLFLFADQPTSWPLQLCFRSSLRGEWMTYRVLVEQTHNKGGARRASSHFALKLWIWVRQFFSVTTSIYLIYC